MALPILLFIVLFSASCSHISKVDATTTQSFSPSTPDTTSGGSPSPNANGASGSSNSTAAHVPSGTPSLTVASNEDSQTTPDSQSSNLTTSATEPSSSSATYTASPNASDTAPEAATTQPTQTSTDSSESSTNSPLSLLTTTTADNTSTSLTQESSTTDSGSSATTNATTAKPSNSSSPSPGTALSNTSSSTQTSVAQGTGTPGNSTSTLTKANTSSSASTPFPSTEDLTEMTTENMTMTTKRNSSLRASSTAATTSARTPSEPAATTPRATTSSTTLPPTMPLKPLQIEVRLQIRLEDNWSNDLDNSSSDLYKHKKFNYTVLLTQVYGEAPGFQRVEILNFSKGSIKVHHKVHCTLDPEDENPLVKFLNITALKNLRKIDNNASIENLTNALDEVVHNIERMKGSSADRCEVGYEYDNGHCQYKCNEKNCGNGKCIILRSGDPMCECDTEDDVVYSGETCSVSTERLKLPSSTIIGIAAGSGGGLIIVFIVVIVIVRRRRSESNEKKESAEEDRPRNMERDYDVMNPLHRVSSSPYTPLDRGNQLQTFDVSRDPPPKNGGDPSMSQGPYNRAEAHHVPLVHARRDPPRPNVQSRDEEPPPQGHGQSVMNEHRSGPSRHQQPREDEQGRRDPRDFRYGPGEDYHTTDPYGRGHEPRGPRGGNPPMEMENQNRRDPRDFRYGPGEDHHADSYPADPYGRAPDPRGPRGGNPPVEIDEQGRRDPRDFRYGPGEDYHTADPYVRGHEPRGPRGGNPRMEMPPQGWSRYPSQEGSRPEEGEAMRAGNYSRYSQPSPSFQDSLAPEDKFQIKRPQVRPFYRPADSWDRM